MKNADFPGTPENVDAILDSGKKIKGQDRRILRNYLSGAVSSNFHTDPVQTRIDRIRETLGLSPSKNAILNDVPSLTKKFSNPVAVAKAEQEKPAPDEVLIPVKKILEDFSNFDWVKSIIRRRKELADEAEKAGVGLDEYIKGEGFGKSFDLGLEAGAGCNQLAKKVVQACPPHSWSSDICVAISQTLYPKKNELAAYLGETVEYVDKVIAALKKMIKSNAYYPHGTELPLGKKRSPASRENE